MESKISMTFARDNDTISRVYSGVNPSANSEDLSDTCAAIDDLTENELIAAQKLDISEADFNLESIVFEDDVHLETSNSRKILMTFAKGDATINITYKGVNPLASKDDLSNFCTLINDLSESDLVAVRKVDVTDIEIKKEPPNLIGGTSEDDTIDNVGDNYTIFSGEGDDLLNVVGNYNYVDAGAGNDTIIFDGDSSTLLGGADNDYIYADCDSISIDGGEGIDTVYAEVTNSTITGGEGNDSLSIQGNTNIIEGGADNDTIIYSGDSSTITGGGGNDSLIIRGNNDIVEGGDGNDYIYYTGNGGYIRANSGNDTILANVTNCTIDANTGNTHISLIGGTGNTILASEGNTTIFGYSPGMANIVIGTRTNTAQSGNDAVITNSAGYKTVVKGRAASVVRINNTNLTIGDTVAKKSRSSITPVYGSTAADSLASSANKNNAKSYMYGGDGNDTLISGTAVSEYYGGDGNDYIKAQANVNTNKYFYGGDGNDTFMIPGAAGAANVNFDGGKGNDNMGMVASAYDKVSLYVNYAGNIAEGTDSLGCGTIEKKSMDFNASKTTFVFRSPVTFSYTKNNPATGYTKLCFTSQLDPSIKTYCVIPVTSGNIFYYNASTIRRAFSL